MKPQFPPKGRHHLTSRLKNDHKVLIFVETQFSRLGQEIIALLEANRIRFKVALAGKGLPYLTHSDKGKYGVIIFENFLTYLKMDKWNRQLLDKYCRDYNAGMISFFIAREDTPQTQEVPGFPLTIHSNLDLRDYEINPHSEVLRIVRAGETAYGGLPDDNWTIFVANHSSYQSLGYAKSKTLYNSPIMNSIKEEVLLTTAIQDFGYCDGIRRVLFGNGIKFWLHRLLLLDSLSYLSHGKFGIPLERYIQIDIDDIFVGKRGTRMVPGDVKALLEAQERLKLSIEGFKFNLGFSGKYFHHGTPEENRGDDLLLENKRKFNWFGHHYKHLQAHKLNDSFIERQLLLNKAFAEEHGIPVDNNYAVAPHHSGVYPVHEQLYEAWKKVWGVKVTSTEEYPHLRPARYRRGFIHRNIMVLPRQTCGLYTHTIYIDRYPGGRDKLDKSIRGGEIFQTVVYNPLSIFMTHLSNYGNDRLALYTFESVIKFAQCWTNLKFFTLPPIQMGKKYFDMYPEEEDPIWQNPCDDRRHLAIWSANKTCTRLPRFLVIGPQKTGTTALYTFLAMHPTIMSNYNSKDTFEEVQFFHGQNYFKGIDWYMNFFPIPKNPESSFLFEKSANYFDNDNVPVRAHALLPRAKLITILISPSKRAYSWYQHMRMHRDKVALAYSFYDVVTADENSPQPLRNLRHRCLNPGMYAQHIERWLDYYQPKQLLILDGEQLKSNPIGVMEKVQKFLRIQPHYDYKKYLKYDPKKGFYCQVKGDRTKCLGRSKGRLYPPMEVRAEKYLEDFYRKHNIALSKLLTRLGQPAPAWLQEDLSHFV